MLTKKFGFGYVIGCGAMVWVLAIVGVISVISLVVNIGQVNWWGDPAPGHWFMMACLAVTILTGTIIYATGCICTALLLLGHRPDCELQNLPLDQLRDNSLFTASHPYPCFV